MSEVEDYSDLPPELLAQLRGFPAPQNELEQQIMLIMKARDGRASLDQILVDLWRRFNVLQKRRFTQNLLYRMRYRKLIEDTDEMGVFRMASTKTQPKDAQP